MSVEARPGCTAGCLRRCIEKDETDDEYINIVEMESAVFSKNISNDEEQGCPWYYACHPPAFVMSGRSG